MSIQDKREQRAKLVQQARTILDAADSESRSITAEEEQKFDAIMADADALTGVVERESRLAGFDADLSETRTRVTRFEPTTGMDEVVINNVSPRGTDQYRQAFNNYLRTGDRREIRALEVGEAAEGGNVVDDAMGTEIVKKADEMSFVRGLSRVITTNSDTKIPVESTKVAAAIVAEEGAYGETDPAFGSTTLSSYKLSCLVKVSEELLFDSEFNLSAYLSDAFGRAFGIAEDSYFLTGTGSGQPTGVINTSGVGGVTAAAVAAITSDEIIDMYHAVSNEYRRGNSLAWAAADGTIKLIRKLKDGDSQYLWQPGLQAGQPETLMGVPIYANSNMPAATAGLKSLTMANFDYFYIADRGGINVQRLDELYAGNGQVGFRAYRRIDGALVQGAAGSVLTMKAS
jgi:HK97 family phage major capsid protein